MGERSDYILGTKWFCFKIVVMKGVSNYPSDHFSLRASLIIFPTKSGYHENVGGLPEKTGTVHGYIEKTGTYQKYAGWDQNVGQEIE